MKAVRMLLVSLAVLAFSSTAALACGPYEWMLPFGNTQGDGAEPSSTGKLPTLHEADDVGAMPVPLPLKETGELIIQILRSLPV